MIMDVKIKGPSMILFATLLVSAGVLSSGCFHTGSTKQLLFPDNSVPVRFVRGTIAQARYNFTGAFTDSTVPVGAQERHLSVDNFYIGEGGADLFIWAQVHFGPVSSTSVDFERFVHVYLIYGPGSEDERIIVQNRYSAPRDASYDRAELLATLNGTGPGLYSLKVEGVGTATQEGSITDPTIIMHPIYREGPAKETAISGTER